MCTILCLKRPETHYWHEKWAIQRLYDLLQAFTGGKAVDSNCSYYQPKMADAENGKIDFSALFV